MPSCGATFSSARWFLTCLARSNCLRKEAHRQTSEERAHDTSRLKKGLVAETGAQLLMPAAFECELFVMRSWSSTCSGQERERDLRSRIVVEAHVTVMLAVTSFSTAFLGLLFGKLHRFHQRALAFPMHSPVIANLDLVESISLPAFASYLPCTKLFKRQAQPPIPISSRKALMY